ncbi:MAG: InlB B-repeat-containing protein [Clostridiaceae bacterium]
MRRIFKKSISLLLILCMVLPFMPSASFAVGQNIAISFGAGPIKDYAANGNGTYDYVYFGGIKWRVLDDSGNSGSYDFDRYTRATGNNQTDFDNGLYYAYDKASFTAAEGSYDPSGIYYTKEAGVNVSETVYYSDDPDSVEAPNALFLLSENVLNQGQQYHATNVSEWSTSDIRKYLNAIDEDYSAASYKLDSSTYASKDGEVVNASENGYNFFSEYGFTDVEIAAILHTTKSSSYNSDSKFNAGTSQTYNNLSSLTYYSGSLDGDQVFLLSAEELMNRGWGLDNIATRQMTSNYCWLRSSTSSGAAGSVYKTGELINYSATGTGVGVRPALNLNQAAVLFASDAAEGKMAVAGTTPAALASTGTQTWRLTLIDDTNQSVTVDSAEDERDETATIYWSNATVGSGMWVSAIVVDTNGTESTTDDEIVSYVKLGSAAENGSGHANINLSLAADEELRVFSENCAASATGTDYASTPQAVLQAVEYDACTVSYDANGGSGTMTDANNPYNDGSMVTTLTNGFTRENYTFTGWNTAVDGMGTAYAEGATFIISANTTLYAQWSYSGSSGDGDDFSIVMYDGNILNFYQNGGLYIKEGIVYASAEELTSQAGLVIETQDEGLIEFTNVGIDFKAEAYIGKNEVMVNNVKRGIQGAPEIIDGAIMFPVKEFFNMLNCSVKKDGNNLIVESPVAKVFADKEVIVKRAEASPIIDGKVEDAAWQEAEKLRDFTTVFYDEKPKSDTEFMVTYDNAAMYIYIDCASKPVSLEAISIVFAPEAVIGDQTPHYSLLLRPEPENNAGRKGGITVSYSTAERHEITEYEVAYIIGDNSWSAELKIPYSAMIPEEGKPAPVVAYGDTWRLNMYRFRPFTEGASSWIPTRYSLYEDYPTGKSAYAVDVSFAPITNMTGSIFFENQPVTVSPCGGEKDCISVSTTGAGLIYKGYTEKALYFNKGNLSVNDEYRAEMINEKGEISEVQILSIKELNDKIFFNLKHPVISNEGLYRINICKDSGTFVEKYGVMFNKQAVMEAGARYNSYLIKDVPPEYQIQMDGFSISQEAEKLISIIPDQLGFYYTGDPARPNALPYSLYNYYYGSDPFTIIAKTASETGIKTTVTLGEGIIPEIYANNKSITVKTKTGKDIVYDFYEDENGKQYFMDQYVKFCQKAAFLGQIGNLAKTDPVGAAYALYKVAKAYQDWSPTSDYPWRTYPTEWEWGAPYPYFGGIWDKWYTAELSTMQPIVDAYGELEKTNAFEIVSQYVGEDVEALLADKVFENALEYVKTFSILNHNMEYNNWLGRIAMSKATGNPDYIHETVDLVDKFTSNGFMLDGFWKEVSFSYHEQSINGLVATLDKLNGWSDPVGYISPRTGQNFQNLAMYQKYPVLNAAKLMNSMLIYPNGKAYPSQDTWANDKSKANEEDWKLGSMFLSAANIARLSIGEGKDTDQLYMAYAPKYGHKHYDPLQLSLFAKGQELLPDLGYTHTIYRKWATSTMSHNTVVVDSKDMVLDDTSINGGVLETFANTDQTVQVMKADFANAYPELEEYDREPWYIKMEGSDDNYVIDIFRVDGGNRHEYTLNGDANSEMAELTANVDMNYYGPYLLPEGTKVTQPIDENDTGDAEGNYYGYLYIEDVKKADLEDGKYEVSLETKDGDTKKAGMKITGFAGNDSELLIGKAPSLRPVRLDTSKDKNELVTGCYMPKMVVRREGTDLQSTFVNVMEPYATGSSAKITSIEKLQTVNPKDIAVEVTYPYTSIPGSTITDVIISNSDPSVPLTVGDITLNGKMAFVRYLDDQVSGVYTVEAESVVINGQNYAGGSKFEGNVVNTMRKAENADTDAFVVDTTVPDTAVGKTITITHPDGSAHAFTVAGVTPQGQNTIIEVTGGDPGFDMYEDGSSKLLFYPLTSWKGGHTFKIAMETAADTGVINHDPSPINDFTISHIDDYTANGNGTYDYVYFGGIKWRVLDDSGNSGSYAFDRYTRVIGNNQTDFDNGLYYTYDKASFTAAGGSYDPSGIYYTKEAGVSVSETASYSDGSSTVDASNALFLLSENVLNQGQQYHATNVSEWSTSDIRKYLNAINEGYSAASYKLDSGSYASKNGGVANASEDGYNFFSEYGFTDAEIAAILHTTKSSSYNSGSKFNAGTSQTYNNLSSLTYYSGSLNGEQVFLLSAEELMNSGWGLNNITPREMTSNYCWLRSSTGSGAAGSVYKTGELINYSASGTGVGVRPALNLNQAAIIFASDATEGKMAEAGSTPQALARIGTQKWRLTLIDDANQSVTVDAAEDEGDGTATIYWSNATVGSGMWVSAIVADTNGTESIEDDEIVSYVKLGSAAENGSGNVRINLSLAADEELRVFSENCSASATGTDYASTPQAVLQAVEYDACTVSYDANGGSGSMTDANSPYVNASTVTTLTNGFTRENYTFTGWNTAADGMGTEYAEGETFTISANTTLYAQWSECSQHGAWKVSTDMDESCTGYLGTSKDTNIGNSWFLYQKDIKLPEKDEDLYEIDIIAGNPKKTANIVGKVTIANIGNNQYKATWKFDNENAAEPDNPKYCDTYTSVTVNDAHWNWSGEKVNSGVKLNKAPGKNLVFENGTVFVTNETTIDFYVHFAITITTYEYQKIIDTIN